MAALLWLKFFLCLAIVVSAVVSEFPSRQNRTFQVDYPNNRFLKDGQPFRYVSGSIHYFRVPRPYWRDRLRKMKFGGLNAIQTYVEWSTHEPEPGHFRFDGQEDLVQFIRTAQEENLLVLLRVGPYICAEREMGGFPYWLLKTSGIRLRSSDPKFLTPVNRWLDRLLPMIKPLLYQNGGPIIMLQVENEYGSWSTNEQNYTVHLRDRFRKHLGAETVLYTTDGNGDSYLRRGWIPDTLTTVDFGSGTNVSQALITLRHHLKSGPFVNSEYYSGWIDLWESAHSMVAIDRFCQTLDQMLALNASVNIYMYHGGTNFGFKAGGNRLNQKNNGLTPTITSYDYDAPISEAGDLTEKFFATKRIIEKYLPPTATTADGLVVPPNTTEKMELPPITMIFVGSLFDFLPPKPIHSKYPLTFEDVDLAYGFLLYQTNLTFHPTNPAVLSVPGLRDRGHVFVDGVFQGILSSTQQLFNVSILARNGSQLSILVENQGRCSYSCIGETRGIVSNVTVNQGQHRLEDWHIYKLYDEWETFLFGLQAVSGRHQSFRAARIDRQPSFYVGNFTVPDRQGYPADTFLRLDGWSKGVAWLNGHNLGRFWTVAGPQITLYAPGIYFRPPGQPNQLALFELDGDHQFTTTTTGERQVHFVKQHVINGSYPD